MASLSRFDQIVVGVITFLALLTLGLVVRGDQVGLQVMQLSPVDGATRASTQQTLRVTFDQLLLPSDDVTFTLEPVVTGDVVLNGRFLTFTPDTALTSGQTYEATLSGTLVGQRGRELVNPVTWSFQVGEPLIAYIGWNDTRSGNQLYVASPNGSDPRPLTDEPHNVLNFAVSPDGSTIAYTATTEEGLSNLWAIDSDGGNRRQLLECLPDACNNPAWSPDSSRLIYERNTYLEIGGPPGPPRLWWLDVATGETTPVFQSSQYLGLAPNFAPSGDWISFAAPQSQELQAYGLGNGETIQIESRTGEPGSWSPDGRSLTTTQMQVDGSNFSILIVRTDVGSGELQNLSGEINTNDSWPKWSPDGEWIAFTRKEPRTPQGKQVWIMRPDGSDQQNLTNTVELHFGEPSWGVNGRSLTFQGYSLTEPEQPAIWLYDLETEELIQVASPGIQPSWLP